MVRQHRSPATGPETRDRLVERAGQLPELVVHLDADGLEGPLGRVPTPSPGRSRDGVAHQGGQGGGVRDRPGGHDGPGDPGGVPFVGVLHHTTLRRNRRYAIVGIVALVALLTPSGDPFTLLILSVPMLLFYELAILVGRLRERRRNRT